MPFISAKEFRLVFMGITFDYGRKMPIVSKGKKMDYRLTRGLPRAAAVGKISIGYHDMDG